MNKPAILTVAVSCALILAGCSHNEPTSNGTETVSEQTPSPSTSATNRPLSNVIQPDESGAPSPENIELGCYFAIEFLTYNFDETTDQRTNRLQPYLNSEATIHTEWGPKIVRPERSTLPGYYAHSTATLEDSSYTYDVKNQSQARCFINYDAVFGDGTGNEYTDSGKNLWLVTLAADGKVLTITEP